MKQSTLESDKQLVSFYLEDHLYGFDIQIVKEVNTNTRISPVPLSSYCIRGLLNIRGQIVLVMDISVIFGRQPRPVTPDSQIVIMKTEDEIRQIEGILKTEIKERFGNKPIGFIIDKIGDVVNVNMKNIEATPPHLSKENAKYVEGVTNYNNDLLIVLNAEELLNIQ